MRFAKLRRVVGRHDVRSLVTAVAKGQRFCFQHPPDRPVVGVVAGGTLRFIKGMMFTLSGF
ncbi:MAG: hypothetical protein PVTTEEND_000628 [Candidatus Fervidibacter sp.]